jgi:hypothetical protein
MILKVKQIARLTGYTERHIRNECQAGLLPARRVPFAPKRERYEVEEADYLIWRQDSPRKRRGWQGKRPMKEVQA